MKVKKGMTLLLASAAMVSLAGCGGNSGGSTDTALNAGRRKRGPAGSQGGCDADNYQSSDLLHPEERVG